MPAVFDTILSKDTLKCMLLLETLEDLETRIKNHTDDRTVLMDLCTMDMSVVVERLLSLGANPNTTDSSGLTALHYCMSKRENKCVEILLKYGADPNMKTYGGRTPYELAESNGDTETVLMLKRYDAM